MIIWSSAFARDTESNWSKLQKLAWLNETSPYGALQLLTNNRAKGKEGACLSEISPKYAAWTKCEELLVGEASENAESMERHRVVMAFAPTSREWRFSRVGMGWFDTKNLRFCRSCLDEGTHLLIHQLSVLEACPIHGDGLMEACPGCGQSIPNQRASKGVPYACVRCRASLLSQHIRSTEHEKESDDIRTAGEGGERETEASDQLLIRSPSDWEETTRLIIDPILLWMEDREQSSLPSPTSRPWFPARHEGRLRLVPSFAAAPIAIAAEAGDFPWPPDRTPQPVSTFPLTVAYRRGPKAQRLNVDRVTRTYNDAAGLIDRTYHVEESCLWNARQMMLATTGSGQCAPMDRGCVFAIARELLQRRRKTFEQCVISTILTPWFRSNYVTDEELFNAVASSFYFSVDCVQAYQELKREERSSEALCLANDGVFDWNDDPWLRFNDPRGILGGHLSLSTTNRYGPSTTKRSLGCPCGLVEQ